MGRHAPSGLRGFSLAPVLRFSTPGAHMVEIESATINIQTLRIERPSIVDYLKTITPDKQEIALVHALEVGVTELAARRERFVAR
jgi:hypothetical protein